MAVLDLEIDSRTMHMVSHVQRILSPGGHVCYLWNGEGEERDALNPSGTASQASRI